MKHHVLLLITLFFLCIAAAAAQPIDSLWSHTFGGSEEDICESVQRTADGGYVLAGYTQSYGTGYSDFWLVKTDSAGNSLWSRTYGGNGRDYCQSVCQTSDGGYALTGYTFSYSTGGADCWLVKTDADGDSLWSRVYGGSYDENFTSVQELPDGGYLLTGSTTSFGNTLPDFWLMKADADGDSLWSNTFGGEEMDYCFAALQTADGGYVLAGATESFGDVDGDFWLVKTDADGDSLWSRTFGGSGHEHCRAVQQTADGGYILAGGTYSFGGGGCRFWMVKTDANGDSLWSVAFDEGDQSDCHAVYQTADGGYALAGLMDNPEAESWDFWLVRTDAGGNLLWDRTYGGNEDDYCYSAVLTTDGGYALAGATHSYGAGYYDFWLVNTGPEGMPVGERQIATPQQYSLSVYPNPFNPVATLEYRLPKASDITISVYDILGRQVDELLYTNVSAGRHSIAWDGSGCATGLYLIVMESADFRAVRKAMLMR